MSRFYAYHYHDDSTALMSSHKMLTWCNCNEFENMNVIDGTCFLKKYLPGTFLSKHQDHGT